MSKPQLKFVSSFAFLHCLISTIIHVYSQARDLKFSFLHCILVSNPIQDSTLLTLMDIFQPISSLSAQQHISRSDLCIYLQNYCNDFLFPMLLGSTSSSLPQQKHLIIRCSGTKSCSCSTSHKIMPQLQHRLHNLIPATFPLDSTIALDIIYTQISLKLHSNLLRVPVASMYLPILFVFPEMPFAYLYLYSSQLHFKIHSAFWKFLGNFQSGLWLNCLQCTWYPQQPLPVSIISLMVFYLNIPFRSWDSSLICEIKTVIYMLLYPWDSAHTVHSIHVCGTGSDPLY